MMGFASALLKAKVREALRGRWLTALLIAMTVNLPSLLVQGIAISTGNDLMTHVQGVLTASMNAAGTAVDQARLIRGLEEIQATPGIWVMQGLNILTWLIIPFLTLGMNAWLLGRLRKEEDPGASGVFSRLRLFLPGIGLRLYITWRVFLGMLPGILLSLASLLPIWLKRSASREALVSALNTSMTLQSIGVIVMLVLGVLSALKYALGDVILADRPETGPVRAAKESKRLLKGMRGSVFSLYLSFLGWYLLEMFVSTLAEGMVGPIFGLVIQMLGSLALSVYLSGTVAAFYLALVPAREAMDRMEAIIQEETEEKAPGEKRPRGDSPNDEESDGHPWER